MGWQDLWRRATSLPPRSVDLAAGVLLGAGLLGRWLGENGPAGLATTAVLATAAVAAGAAVAVRRAAPVPACAAACVAGVVVALFGQNEPGVLAVGLTGYLVGTSLPQARAVATAVIASTGMTAAVLVTELGLGSGRSAGPVMPVAVLATSVAIGVAVRGRRELHDALRAAERRRAIEQRLHIAHEVHDLVGHHIAVINVQAGVAAHHLRRRPDEAEQALGHVRDAARTVLDELATILAVLRETGARPEPTEPAPRLAELDRLVESITSTGTTVDWTVSGRPRALAPAVELAAYRTIQESLTNAGKHGSGEIRLRVDFAGAELTVEVRNPVDRPAGTAGGTGYGLVGMSERVAATGGTVLAGVRDDEFVVLATWPLVPGAPRGGGTDEEQV